MPKLACVVFDGAKVRTARLEASLSQEDLARRSRCSFNTIRRIEAGGTRVGLAIAATLSRALGRSQRDLLANVGPIDKPPESAAVSAA